MSGFELWFLWGTPPSLTLLEWFWGRRLVSVAFCWYAGRAGQPFTWSHRKPDPVCPSSCYTSHSRVALSATRLPKPGQTTRLITHLPNRGNSLPAQPGHPLACFPDAHTALPAPAPPGPDPGKTFSSARTWRRVLGGGVCPHRIPPRSLAHAPADDQR